MEQIELTVVLPCLNEESCIASCVRKIRDVFAKEGIAGEVIVSDNGSTDKSPGLAAEAGARVVNARVRGYGAAYLRGLKEARGTYIIIADSDNTYDFYDIPEFLERLRAGDDFVMGSRFKGKIEKGAMPWMNRFIGNPILSGMCRLFFSTKLSDIHCGMRGFTNAAYRKMELKSPGMEFATEMVVSALQNKMRISEIPINYHLREGKSKLMPFYDAWRHIRFMLLYCPLWLYFVPGLLGFLGGLVILFLLLPGPFLFLGRYWDIHIMVFASAICILSYQILNLGVFAHILAIKEGYVKAEKVFLLVNRHFNLEKGLFLGAGLFLCGFLINLAIFIEWYSSHFGPLYRIRESILAMTLLVIGLQTIFSSFFISLLFLNKIMIPSDENEG
jgi:glycosyltransferase involved in cell wall biosynthesis